VGGGQRASACDALAALKVVRSVLFACLLILSAAAWAQEPEDIDQGLLDETKLRSLEQASGFVVDRTITHFGAEFVRYFSQAWRELPGTAEVDVTIVERPSARHGSLVMVEHNNRPVVRAFLYAGRGGTIRPVALAAADYVASRIADETLAGLLLEDADLAKEGF
jgi:curli production assembly/transport component CsgE